MASAKSTNTADRNSLPRSLKIALLSFALLLRILVGFHPHSGQDDYQGDSASAIVLQNNNNNDSNTLGEQQRSAKYGGDYEAQRHWMEITYHLPLSEWYRHDLEYWGLDYPPLTAYVSYACGWVAHHVGSLHDDAFEEDNNEHEHEHNETGTCEESSSSSNDLVCRETTKTKARTTQARKRRGLRVLKELVALHSSRFGFEDAGGKLYMRFTVLILDMAVYMSAVWVLVARLTAGYCNPPSEIGNQNDDDTITSNNVFGMSLSQHRRIWLLLTTLSQPALILVDHGHFQYNTVSLGLGLWSFHFMTLDTNPFLQNDNSPHHSSSFVGPILGSILFSLALNFKQMELYHAPAIFAYLLGRCFRQYSPNSSNDNTKSRDDGADKVESKRHIAQASNYYAQVASKFAALGLTVIITFAVLWLPFAMYPEFNVDGVLQILRRLFPFQRGLFEGKVSNLWCALSIKPFSIRNRIPANLLPLTAMGLTLILLMPSCWMLFGIGKGHSRNNDRQSTHSNQQQNGLPLNQHMDELQQNLYSNQDIRLLLWGSTSTSLAFFLASFQVHEKGILIALAPLSLLAADAPNFVSWFSIAATWTLWPLLIIDRLCEAYVCCLVIYLCINSMVGLPSSKSNPNNADVDIFSHRYFTRFIPPLSFAVMILLHMSEWVVAPPSHLPDLFPVLWSLMGCGMFCISFAATLWAMFVQVAKGNTTQKAKGNTKRNTKAKSAMQTKVCSLVGIACLCGATFGDAFLFSPLSRPTHLNQWTMSTAISSFVFSPQKNNMLSFLALHSSNKNFDIDAILTSDLLARARVPLAWEVQQARDSKPVLNLSVRDPGTLSLSDEAMSATGDDFDEASMMDDKDGSWEDGHLWVDTERQLISLGVLLDSKDTKAGDENKLVSKLSSESILSRAPQLLRLPSLQIIDSAHFFLSGGNATADAMDSGSICSSTAPSKPKWSLALLLQVDPSLLTYRADDLYHGLEYLTNMMARGNRAVIIQTIQSQYFLSPLMATQLFKLGVDSGMDERRVSLALGNAAKASGKAVQGIVGDLGKDIRELKRIKGGKGSL